MLLCMDLILRKVDNSIKYFSEISAMSLKRHNTYSEYDFCSFLL